ncbi:MAG: hypothetical protein V3T89_02130 [bacterium]
MKERMKNFKPRINFYEAEYYLQRPLLETKLIKSSKIYELLKRLTGEAFPSRKDKFEKVWENFYLPVKRSGKLIAVPFTVIEYKREFFIYFHILGNLHLKKGNEKVEKIYEEIFKEALRFVKVIKETKNRILLKTVPYDIRTGKIKGRYVLEKLLPEEEEKRILSAYKKRLKKNLKFYSVSLNEYLKVASICYKAAYGNKAKNLSPYEMYKKWADGRDGGMLSIRNGNSKEEFMKWYSAHGWIGAHPFEIVFSWHNHGIHLYPPDKSKPYFVLRVTNYAYARDFVKMVKALIKHNMPFRARDLEEVLSYLRGETYFTVNDHAEHFFFYIPSREYKKLYFKHIEWDELKVPEWKGLVSLDF